jgi:hypothetical protein
MSEQPALTANDLPVGMTDLEERMRAEGGTAVRDDAVAALEAAMDRSGKLWPFRERSCWPIPPRPEFVTIN